MFRLSVSPRIFTTTQKGQVAKNGLKLIMADEIAFNMKRGGHVFCPRCLFAASSAR
jgi:hypothetical protein